MSSACRLARRDRHLGGAGAGWAPGSDRRLAHRIHLMRGEAKWSGQVSEEVRRDAPVRQANPYGLAAGRAEACPKDDVPDDEV